MSGPKENKTAMSKRIGDVLKFEDVGPMALYLGYIHEEGKLTMDDGRVMALMASLAKIDKRKEFYFEKGGKEVILSRVLPT